MKVLLCMSLNKFLLGYQRASEFVDITNLCLAGPGEVERPLLCLHPPKCLAVLDWGFLPVFFSEFSEIIDVLSNMFSVDVDHVSIAIDSIIVLLPSPNAVYFNSPAFTGSLTVRAICESCF